MESGYLLNPLCLHTFSVDHVQVALYMKYVVSLGMLKIHSGGSSLQQTVLTIPANQLKQLGVATGSGGLQTILMPVGKGTQASPLHCYFSVTLFLKQSVSSILHKASYLAGSISDAELCTWQILILILFNVKWCPFLSVLISEVRARAFTGCFILKND